MSLPHAPKEPDLRPCKARATEANSTIVFCAFSVCHGQSLLTDVLMMSSYEKEDIDKL
jgi:hypothetical protein